MRMKSESRAVQNRKERIATWGRACCRVPPDIASSIIVQFLKEIAAFSGGQRTRRWVCEKTHNCRFLFPITDNANLSCKTAKLKSSLRRTSSVGLRSARRRIVSPYRFVDYGDRS